MSGSDGVDGAPASAPGLSPAAAELARWQDGVITRRQLLAHGHTDADIRRLVRRRVLAPVLPGTYLLHTGPPSRTELHRAGVLHWWPAALGGHDALRVGIPGWRHARDDADVEILVEAHRRVSSAPGFALRRVVGLADRIMTAADLPRLRVEEALLDLVAAELDPVRRVGLLADGCGSRRTTPHRLLGALRRRSRHPARTWTTAVLTDLTEGTCSVLEHAYLTRVERAHGLPKGVRQQPVLGGTGRSGRSDVEYAALRTVVELDGMLFHASSTQPRRRPGA